MSSEHDGKKTKLAIVCFFLGVLGVHRFMVGKIGTGMLMLITLGGGSIWTLVDFVMILTGNFTDKAGNKITS
jgi:TM2 domain-containing membrane protein YozV